MNLRSLAARAVVCFGLLALAAGCADDETDVESSEADVTKGTFVADTRAGWLHVDGDALFYVASGYPRLFPLEGAAQTLRWKGLAGKGTGELPKLEGTFVDAAVSNGHVYVASADKVFDYDVATKKLEERYVDAAQFPSADENAAPGQIERIGAFEGKLFVGRASGDIVLVEGGQSRVLATKGRAPIAITAMQLAGDTLFWGEQGRDIDSSYLCAIKLEPGAKRESLNRWSNGWIDSIASNDAGVFFVRSTNYQSSVIRVDHATHERTTLIESMAGGQIVADASGLYVANNSASAEAAGILFVPAESLGSATPVTPKLAKTDVHGIAIAGDDLVYATKSGVLRSAKSKLFR